ncbi:MFS transporter [Falsibacillus albus]|uniref:MFS transporter n=1 Tax=Falsibacillus albus TaxID=2478915 RepID=A0A3L7JZ65_9BACI|nr:MFS transporter [Falsibacillus albus]
MRWFIVSQSLSLMASSVAFPFYLLFIKNIGSNFSSFGIAYGLFTLSSALVHRLAGRAVDAFGSKLLLGFHAVGMSLIFLFIPNIISLHEVYFFQFLLGLLGSLQKNGEKSYIAKMSEGSNQGRIIGNYHFWTSIYSALAVMGCGMLIDYFTIHVIFYICSLFYFCSGLTLLCMKESNIKKSLKRRTGSSIWMKSGLD